MLNEVKHLARGGGLCGRDGLAAAARILRFARDDMNS
jgi:hypothetical protein